MSSLSPPVVTPQRLGGPGQQPQQQQQQPGLLAQGCQAQGHQVIHWPPVWEEGEGQADSAEPGWSHRPWSLPPSWQRGVWVGMGEVEPGCIADLACGRKLPGRRASGLKGLRFCLHCGLVVCVGTTRWGVLASAPSRPCLGGRLFPLLVPVEGETPHPKESWFLMRADFCCIWPPRTQNVTTPAGGYMHLKCRKVLGPRLALLSAP